MITILVKIILIILFLVPALYFLRRRAKKAKDTCEKRIKAITDSETIFNPEYLLDLSRTDSLLRESDDSD